MINFIYCLGILTISFDVLLNFNVGPNVRISQLILLIFIIYSFLLIINKKILIPIGFKYLLFWCFFVIIFIPNSGFIEKGVGYSVWLILNILIIFFTVQYYSRSLSFIKIIKFYIISFVFVGLFGILQFISGIFGLGDFFLVQTWWIPNVLPRVNGFSYEPSFYATYLMLGWISISYILQSKIYIFSKFSLILSFSIISFSLIVSGSRLGYVFMLFWTVFNIFKSLFFNRRKNSNFKFSLIALGLIILVTIILFNIFDYSDSDITHTLAFGTGLGETSSHSVDERLSGAYDLLEIFTRSPLIGYSLGGLSYALGNLKGITVNDFISAKLEGNSVFLEVLAASGILGFIPFLLYIYSLISRPFKLNFADNFSCSAKILHGMTWALIFELLMLQANQNILRPYLWLHIAIMSTLYSAIVLKNPSLSNKNYDRC